MGGCICEGCTAVPDGERRGREWKPGMCLEGGIRVRGAQTIRCISAPKPEQTTGDLVRSWGMGSRKHFLRYAQPLCGRRTGWLRGVGMEGEGGEQVSGCEGRACAPDPVGFVWMAICCLTLGGGAVEAKKHACRNGEQRFVRFVKSAIGDAIWTETNAQIRGGTMSFVASSH